MYRWALICQNSIKTLPPHAMQLKDMVPIQSIQLEATDDSLEEDEEKDQYLGLHFGSGLTTSTLFAKDTRQWHVSDLHQDIEGLESQNQWETLDMIVQLDLWAMFEHLFPKTWNRDLCAHTSDNNYIFPSFHGTFTPPEPKTASSFLKKSTALRRTDAPSIHTAPHLYDCDADLYGKQVNFKTPTYDIELELSKLITDPQYKSKASKVIASIDYSVERNYLNSWDNPKIPPKVTRFSNV